MIKELTLLANQLDQRGLKNEANYIDDIMGKLAASNKLPQFIEEDEVIEDVYPPDDATSPLLKLPGGQTEVERKANPPDWWEEGGSTVGAGNDGGLDDYTMNEDGEIVASDDVTVGESSTGIGDILPTDKFNPDDMSGEELKFVVNNYLDFIKKAVNEFGLDDDEVRDLIPHLYGATSGLPSGIKELLGIRGASDEHDFNPEQAGENND